MAEVKRTEIVEARGDGCTESRPECSEGIEMKGEGDGRLKGLLMQRAFSGQKGKKKQKKKRVIVLTGARQKTQACSKTPCSCEAAERTHLKMDLNHRSP